MARRFEEEDFFKVFTTYGHGDYLGQVTRIIWANFRSPIPSRLYVKFDWLAQWFLRRCLKSVDNRHWTTDDWQRRPAYLISPPMSIRLRWFKNVQKYDKMWVKLSSNQQDAELPFLLPPTILDENIWSWQHWLPVNNAWISDSNSITTQSTS